MIEKRNLPLDLQTTPEQRDKAINEFANVFDNPPLWSEIVDAEEKLNDELEKGIESGELHDNDDEHIPGSVILPDFQTLEIILRRLGFSPEDAQEMVAHEEEHYHKALKHGFGAKITLKAYIDDETRQKGVLPSIRLVLPNGKIDKEQLKKALQEIVFAPDSPSDSDETQIDRFGLR